MSLDEKTARANGLWYLVHCQQRKEAYATNSLRHLLKLCVFLPESQIRLQGAVRRTPFFPGYIFVHADLQKLPTSVINTCPGVSRLVDFGGGPQPVPPYVIETISKQLDRLNGANVQHYHNIRPGDSVRVKHGPLQDLEMVFIGPSTPSKRVYVLLEILGRLQEVQVDVDVLEKAAGNSNVLLDLHTRRVKYTRGKGRKITY